MTTLWISLLVLALGIAIGAFFTVLQNKRRDRLDAEYLTEEKLPERDDDVLCVRKVNTVSTVMKPVKSPSLSNKQTKSDDKSYSVKVIHVMAKKPHRFNGYDLLQTLLAEGLRYGDMRIFHRHQQSNGKGPILFSLASAAEPGTFDMQTIGEFSCPGVTLFMQLSGTAFDEERYELMLETADHLAEELDGVVCDQSFAPLAQQTTE